MPSGSESERETRRQRIDPLLRSAGWKLVPFEPGHKPNRWTHHAVTEYETANGPADYALFVDGQILGIVEAKKVSLGPQGVLTQAQRYSRGVTESPFSFRGYRVPFLYSTNGEVCWFHDVRHDLNRSREVRGFHTPSGLAEKLAQDFDRACEALQAMPHDNKLLRPYQHEAHVAVEKAISERRPRMLVAMATGTGKTYTFVSEIHRLMKAGVARRVLFLVDRRALAAQAVRAFASFDAEPGRKFDQIYEVYSSRFQTGDFGDDDKFDPKVLPSGYLTDPQPGHAFVYVCTIQRMAINVLGRQAIFGLRDEEIDEDAAPINIPIHAFDAIIADECHRGYTAAEESVWRDTLNHFDAIKIGLTATPASHTTSYFEHVAYRYDYAAAVGDGYLVDYDAVTIHSDVRLNGMFLKEGEQVEVVDTETGAKHMDRLEDEREFSTGDIESKVTAPDSNRKIVEEVKKYALDHRDRFGRYPKTLIFAANDLPHTSHADQLVQICRDAFGQGEHFVQKITGRVDRPLQRIKEFRNRPNPTIAVTVDLLTTGVDIPDLEYIVLLRPVKSRILFEQILGRGTRRGENIIKSHFTVFDCFDGTLLAYFKKATGITDEPPSPPSRTITEIIEDIWRNKDREYNTRCLVKRLHRIDKDMSAEARALFAAYVPDGDVGRFARELPGALLADFPATMKLLRDGAFQGLLTDYPRAPRVFLSAYEVTDSVTSAWLIRDGLGHEHKPEDYLQAFSRFVRENPAKIEAIRVLLSRPKHWNPAALKELKDKLASTPERFTVEALQKAHELRHKKALADIISMVKHAAKEELPLLNAEERVGRAFQKVTSGHTFTSEQEQWLGYIRQHLIQNLSVDREDFDLVPVFTREGGWTVVRRVFGKQQIETLIEQLNEAIAA